MATRPAFEALMGSPKGTRMSRPVWSDCRTLLFSRLWPKFDHDGASFGTATGPSHNHSGVTTLIARETSSASRLIRARRDTGGVTYSGLNWSFVEGKALSTTRRSLRTFSTSPPALRTLTVRTYGPGLVWTSIPRNAKPPAPPGAVRDDRVGLSSAVRPRNVTEADRTVRSDSRKTRTGSPGWSDL